MCCEPRRKKLLYVRQHNHVLWTSSGHIEVVKLLASHGAEVTCKDKKSYTPLHAAASSGMISVVKFLLDLGVDVSLSL